MGKYKYLAGNIALFSISNFVSKILVFLLVPFYTNILSTADYGIADIMQTTLLLLVPALSINMGEAALRFGIERADRRGRILKVGLKYAGIGSLFVTIVCLVSVFFVNDSIKRYLLFFIVLFAANSLYEFLILFFQGCEKVKIVVTGSVFSTIVLISCNLIFLLGIKIGLAGYLLSQIISFTLAGILMMLLAKKFYPEVYEDSSDEGKVFEKELLDYGKPMIMYSTGSWINNAADRYLVSAICGVAVNGIYGVAYKIPSILTVFQRIFAQAWQMSATKSYSEEDSEAFFTTMYKVYNAFMVLGCSFLIAVVRPLAEFLFRKDFYEAWRYVPPLLISVIFGALTGFLGSICLAHKDSKAMGFATGTGAVINIILNLILIPKFSAMGAAVATAVSYYTMYMLAFLNVRKYVKIRASYVRDYIAYILVIAQTFVMIYEIGIGEFVNEYVICSAIFALILIMHVKEAKEIINKFLSKIKR